MKHSFIIALSLFTAVILFSQNAMAHGGGHEKEVTTEPTTDSMYATEGKGEKEPDLGNGLFSPSDLFMANEIVAADEPKMEGSHNEMDEHNMPKVEPAERKAVDTSNKGYGVAVGITLFAGLVFAGLTFIRPGE